MAFIKIDGEIKALRSRYDGHIDSFGWGCASAIQELPPEDLKRLAREFKVVKGEEDEEEPNIGGLAPARAQAIYAGLCEGKLSAEREAMLCGLSSNMPSFGIPYVGLGPVLAAAAGPDCEEWGYSYGYLVDIDRGVFGMIHEQDESDAGQSQLLWEMSFEEIRSIQSERALAKAFEKIGEIDWDWEKPNFKSLKAKVDAILARASAMLDSEETASEESSEDQARAKIMAIEEPSGNGSIPEPGRGKMGTTYSIPQLADALFIKVILEREAWRDPAVAAFAVESGFGFDEQGKAGGQLASRGCQDKNLDERAECLFESFREGIKTVALPESSFAGSGFGGLFGEPEQEPERPKSMSELGARAEEIKRQLSDLGKEAIENRWERFDPTLALHMPRDQWVEVFKASVKRKDLGEEAALNLIATALGAADEELLEAVLESEGCQKAFKGADAAQKDRFASKAATGINLSSCLNPKSALNFARMLAESEMDLRERGGKLERAWLGKPASCVMSRRGELVEWLGAKTSAPAPRYRGF